jgi:FKBP-type peptidyl-prolyl cis-trans isomerase FkpA
VRIDEAGHDDAAAAVDGLARRVAPRQLPDLDDPAAGDRDLAGRVGRELVVEGEHVGAGQKQVAVHDRISPSMYRIFMRPARVAFVAVILLLPLLGACSDDSNPTSPILPGAPYSQTDLEVGTGAEAVVGRTVSVDYVGWIYDPTKPENKGQQFTNSATDGPANFQLGAAQVIPGFEQGVVGMKVGGRRRLVIPPDLAYGSQGSTDGAIPPYATLVFDIKLTSVR